MSEKYIKLEYTPTGNVFTLPEAEARRIYLEDKGFNYKVVKGKLEIKEEKSEETTVYKQIVQDDRTKTTEENKGE